MIPFGCTRAPYYPPDPRCAQTTWVPSRHRHRHEMWDQTLHQCARKDRATLGSRISWIRLRVQGFPSSLQGSRLRLRACPACLLQPRRTCWSRRPHRSRRTARGARWLPPALRGSSQGRPLYPGRATARTAPAFTSSAMTDGDSRCSDYARKLHEPLAGTAPFAVFWLLIEQPGPWGRDALKESHLSPTVGRALADWAARAQDHGPVRLGLIRRPGRHADTHKAMTSRTVLAARSDQGCDAHAQGRRSA